MVIASYTWRESPDVVVNHARPLLAAQDLAIRLAARPGPGLVDPRDALSDQSAGTGQLRGQYEVGRCLRAQTCVARESWRFDRGEKPYDRSVSRWMTTSGAAARMAATRAPRL